MYIVFSGTSLGIGLSFVMVLDCREGSLHYITIDVTIAIVSTSLHNSFIKETFYMYIMEFNSKIVIINDDNSVLLSHIEICSNFSLK